MLSTALSVVILFFGTNTASLFDPPTTSGMMTLPPMAAHAAETTMTTTTTAFKDMTFMSTPGTRSRGERQTFASLSSTITVAQQQDTNIKDDDAAAARRVAAVDEVASLIQKYHVDQTFKGKDWDAIRIKYETLARNANNNDPQQLFDILKDMVRQLDDKYSRMLNGQQYAAIQKYDLIGVGVTLTPNPQKQIVVGAPPVAGSPAETAGLRMGDAITAVNGISTQGRNAFDIIDQIAESPNDPTITFTVVPSDDDAPSRDVILERQFLKVRNPIQYRIAERRQDGTTVGYIRIAEFNGLVKARLQDALQDLQTQGVNAYVLDLRMNTGGAFQSAVEISSLFLEHSVATYVVDNTSIRTPFLTAKGQVVVDRNIPLVLWLDDRSASATEVLAAALHDNCRAVIIGNRNSFGKGLIQAVYGLQQNGFGLVLTVAKYLRPNAQEIQGVGIAPDIIFPPSSSSSQQPALPSLSSMVPPGLVLSTDTSRLDFAAVKQRLDASYCQVPPSL